MRCASQRYAIIDDMIDWARIAEERRISIMAAVLEGEHCDCAFPSIHFHQSFRRRAWQLLLATTASDVQISIRTSTREKLVIRIRSVPNADGKVKPVLLSTPVSWVYKMVHEHHGKPSDCVHVYGVRYLAHFQAPLAAYLWPQLRSISQSLRLCPQTFTCLTG